MAGKTSNSRVRKSAMNLDFISDLGGEKVKYLKYRSTHFVCFQSQISSWN